jgi:hypothetical protein
MFAMKDMPPNKGHATALLRPPAHATMQHEVGFWWWDNVPHIDYRLDPFEPIRRFHQHSMEFERLIRVGDISCFDDVCIRHRTARPERLDEDMPQEPQRELVVSLEVKPRISSTDGVLRQWKLHAAYLSDDAFAQNVGTTSPYPAVQSMLVVMRDDPLLPVLASMLTSGKHFYAWDRTSLWRVPGNMETRHEPVKFLPVVCDGSPTPAWGSPKRHTIH